LRLPIKEKMFTKILIISIGGAFLSGCAGWPGPGHTYRCPDGTLLQVRFSEDRQRAHLRVKEQSVELAHVSSASGSKYSDGKTLFWAKEKKAMVEIEGDIVYRDCGLVDPY
jgi:membrane-bound inhibitor of C-type lysozyme